MYVALIALLAAAALFLVVSGVRSGSRVRLGAGIALALGTGLFFGSLSFWGEMLWFQALGYGDRFWTAALAEGGFALGGALVAGGLVWLLVLTVENRSLRAGALAAAAVVGGLWGFQSWQTLLLFIHQVPTGTADPILGLDASFYLFTLPFLEALLGLLFTVATVGVAATVLWLFAQLGESGADVIELEDLKKGLDGVAFHPAFRGEGDPKRLAAVARAVAALALMAAFDRLLAIPELLYSDLGAVSGPGWTDVHVRLPVMVILAVALVAVAVVLLVPAARARFETFAVRRGAEPRLAGLLGLALPWAAVAGLWFLGLGLVPGLVQSFWVEPNEISFEAPYIAHNIEFTRQGFGLERIEDVEFPATGTFDAAVAERNRELLAETRLWDWRALDAVYKQFQEIRLYYEFVGVDVDRYRIGDRVRQVMVSARELEVGNLPEQSQTFVNRHFKYTHGYGLTMAPVAEFTPQGLPDLMIRDLPPTSEHPELAVERPQIYYGELTDAHVYGNTREEEFDYPSGDENVSIRYPGEGGVVLSNLWRRFVYGWMFDGTRFFLSGYPTAESRILYDREIRTRVSKVAPFLTLDRDPYVVLADGRLYWILDAYTTSSDYPYSEPYDSLEVIGIEDGGRQSQIGQRTVPTLHGARWVRNSVKAVVDAFDGSVDLYVFEPDDPLLQTWSQIFPDLFKDRSEMPAKLMAHVRYPEDYFLVQGLVWAKYHMNDPAVFYNQEDLWVRATEKYYDRVQPVEPYFVMWQPPTAGPEQAPEFTMIQPFTPKNRQVMIGWLAGLSDGDNYGRLLSYSFPKERRILGPQQVETKIDQDPFLSQQLTLWDQRGSRVIRGNVLAIPMEETLLYVEPIYLQAETAAYPELRLVVLMHGDELAYGESFAIALERLVGEPILAGTDLAVAPALADDADETETATTTPPGGGGPVGTDGSTVGGEDALRSLAGDANAAFERYLELQGEGRFEEAGRELDRLQRLLRQLSGDGIDDEAETNPAQGASSPLDPRLGRGSGGGSDG